MTKREEVREGIAIRYARARGMTTFMNGIPKECYRYADKEMKELHSQGVAIKVDRELPESVCAGCSCYFKEANKNILPERVRKAGYVAVEPLIKEE